MVQGCYGQKLFSARCGQGAVLICTALIAFGSVGRSDAGPVESINNSYRQADSSADYDRWMALDGQEPTGLVEDPQTKEQGENEYWDNLFREGISQVEPKKKPLQFRFLSNLKPRRKPIVNSEERMAAKRDLNGVSMSITHNLDILRRGLLRELNMRQREQDRKQIVENNKKFLNGLGK